ncbi:MAG TPA: hypothetical protein VF247_05260 [Candidatus Krumholzibacteria bacterium]
MMNFRIPAWTAALGALALAACEDDTSSVNVPPLPVEYAFVTTTDYTTGAAAFVRADSTLTPYCNVRSIHSDAVARFYQGRIYVVNRNGADNIQVLDPYSSFATIKQFSVGNGSDPHDIAFLSRSRAFVTRFNTDQMWIVDANTGRRSGLIDFNQFADGDNIPEMDHILRVGERMFVAIDRLNRTTDWGPVGPGYLAVFDPYTEQFIDADPFTTGLQPLMLEGANPYAELVLNTDSQRIWVAVAGHWGVADGGIEVVDPVALTTSGIVITEATLGGDVSDVVPIDENRGAAIVTGADYAMLVGFDLTAPTEIDTIYAPGAYVLQDAELSRDGRLFVSDRTNVKPGLRVFNTNTWTQITTDPADVCLPPADIEFGYR